VVAVGLEQPLRRYCVLSSHTSMVRPRPCVIVKPGDSETAFVPVKPLASTSLGCKSEQLNRTPRRVWTGLPERRTEAITSTTWGRTTRRGAPPRPRIASAARRAPHTGEHRSTPFAPGQNMASFSATPRPQPTCGWLRPGTVGAGAAPTRRSGHASQRYRGGCLYGRRRRSFSST
jgi:hypothetical protein